MGQQSLGEFMGLHVEIERVFIDNSLKTDATRKNNTIVNTGDNPTKAERARKIAENQQKYGLSQDEWRHIKLPKRSNSEHKNVVMLEEIDSNKFSTIEKIHHVIQLQRLVEYKIELIKKLGQGYFDAQQENHIANFKKGAGLKKKRIQKSKRTKGLYYDYSSDEEDAESAILESEDEKESSVSSITKGRSVSVFLRKVAENEYRFENFETK